MKLLDKETRMKLLSLVLKCPDVIGEEGKAYYNPKDQFYGIEFSGQTLKIKMEVEPVFDMTDKEVDDMVQLIAFGVPLLGQLLQENAHLRNNVKLLIDTLQDVITIQKEIGDKEVVRVEIAEETPTVGEK